MMVRGTIAVTVLALNLIGERGQDWHLQTAGAFIPMLLPEALFLGLQRFIVRGLPAGTSSVDPLP